MQTPVYEPGYARWETNRETEILAGLPLFSKLDGRSVDAVATLAREVAAPAGTVLMREGEPAESFYGDLRHRLPAPGAWQFRVRPGHGDVS